MSYKLTILLAITSLVLTPCLYAESPTTSITKPVYTFGVVPQFEQRKIFRIWRPILDLLEKHTEYKFKLTGSLKIPVFENHFMSGKYDFAYMNPYHILSANKSQGYMPLVRDGDRTLKGILVVHKDSDINKLTDLNNKEIAFPSPNAFGASLLIRANLKRQHNINFIPRYVHTHSSSYLHVILRQTTAAGGVEGTLRVQKPEIQSQLRIIYETQAISPHPIVAHQRVPKEAREKVKQALLIIGQDPRTQHLFQKIPIKKIVSASLEDYKTLHKLGLEEFYSRP